MSKVGNDAGESRPSAPRRITLQGRTFGNLTLGTPIGSRDDATGARNAVTVEQRQSGPKRITGSRRSVG